ncbi:MAG: response regulator transcription factor [Armatimonadia bacterium]
MSFHILIADDDPDLAEAVGWYLQAEGMRVTVVGEASQVLLALQADPPDAAVLDLGMLGEEGPVLMEAIRRNGPVPVLALSGKSAGPGRERALELGAGDYVEWPYGPMEVLGRLKPLLRRSGARQKAPRQAQGLKVNVEEREVLVHDQQVALTPIEFDLLAALMQHPGVARSRDQLGDEMWGDDYYGELRLVDNHIARLRAKLRAAGLKPVPVVTVRGTGYMYRPEG